MPRSVWKGAYFKPKLLKDSKKPRQVFARNSMILPQFEGRVFNVHNGLKLIPVLVKESMIGHKFGEFAQTRKVYTYKKEKKGK